MSTSNIFTSACLALTDEHMLRRYRVLSELAGRATLTDLLWLSVRDELPSPLERGVVDDVATVASVGDPRIWPLKVARLIASEGSAVRGALGGQLALEGALIGPHTCRSAAELLLEAEAASSLRTVAAAPRRLPGFGVAFRANDERVAALGRCLAARRPEAGRYQAGFERLAEAVRAERGLEPNFGIAMAAALLDLSLSPIEIGVLGVALLHHLFIINAFEAAREGHEAYRCLPAVGVRYEGPAPRLSPRAAKKR